MKHNRDRFYIEILMLISFVMAVALAILSVLVLEYKEDVRLLNARVGGLLGSLDDVKEKYENVRVERDSQRDDIFKLNKDIGSCDKKLVSCNNAINAIVSKIRDKR